MLIDSDKVKNIFKYMAFMAVTLLLCSACELKFKPNEEAEAAVLSVQRYDRLESRYLTTGRLYKAFSTNISC